MAFIIIDSEGNVTEQSREVPQRDIAEDRGENDRRRMPELQIVPIGQAPEIEKGVPPWLIPGILEIINGNRERVEKELPN